MNKRHELIENLAVITRPYWLELHTKRCDVTAAECRAEWLNNAIRDADALLAALDKSPTTQEAAPADEPKEQVCVWKKDRFYYKTPHGTGFPLVKLPAYCSTCGGKIITEDYP